MNRKLATERKCVLFLTVILLILSAVFSSFEVNSAPVVGSNVMTLYPVADAYVNASSPDTNYGSATSLCVSANSEKDFTYVRFDLTSIPSGANILSAKLEMYLSATTGSFYYSISGGQSDTIGAYYCSDNSWVESAITWSNKPVSVSEPTGSWRFGYIFYYENEYKSCDVTADVKTAFSSGILTEALQFAFKTGDGQAFFNSREGSNKPRLVVEYSTQPVSIVHFESAQDPEATNNIGFITIANNVFSLPNDIDVVHGSYQIAYSGGYMFTRWETSGGVTVSDAYSATTTVTVSGSGTLRAVGNVTRLEYSYDHENAGLELQTAGYVDAVRFTPLISGQLMVARFYIESISSYSSNTFKVHVMDENRRDIIDPVMRTPSAKGWFDVDIASYNVNLNTGTDFYIGIEWITDYNPYLGADTSSNFDRSWSWNGTNWQQVTYRDFMIRAVTWTSNPLTYNLTISTTTGGSTSPTSGSHIYNAGTSVSVQANTNMGYLFDHWELDGANVGSTNPYVFTINANHALHGVFTALATPAPTPTATPKPPPVATPTPTLTPTQNPTPPPSPTSMPSPQQTETPLPSANTTSNPQFAIPSIATYVVATLVVVLVVIVAIALALRKRK